MASSLRSDRLDLRLTPEQKRDIERAAALSGRSVSDFSVSTLISRAGEVIRTADQVRLSGQDWDAFNAALETPPVVNPGLRDLLHRPAVFAE